MAKQGMGRRHFLDLLVRGTAAAAMAVSGLNCAAQRQGVMPDSHELSDVVEAEPASQQPQEKQYAADKGINYLINLLVDWAEAYNASAAQDPKTDNGVQEKLESAAVFGKTINLDVRAAVEIYDTPTTDPLLYLAKQARSAETMETLLDHGIVLSVCYSLNSDSKHEISLGVIEENGRAAKKTDKGRQYEQVAYRNIVSNHFNADAQGNSSLRRQCFRRHDKVYIDLEHVDRAAAYLQNIGQQLESKAVKSFAEQMYLEAFAQLEHAARENGTTFAHEYLLMTQSTELEHHEPEHFSHAPGMPREEREKQAYLKEIAEGTHRGRPFNAYALATLADCNLVPDFFEFFASKDMLAQMTPAERSSLAKVKFEKTYR